MGKQSAEEKRLLARFAKKARKRADIRKQARAREWHETWKRIFREHTKPDTRKSYPGESSKYTDPSIASENVVRGVKRRAIREYHQPHKPEWFENLMLGKLSPRFWEAFHESMRAYHKAGLI